jgi:hypothetical protein
MALSIGLVGLSGFIGAFVNDRTLFALLRITTGMGGMGCYMVPYVIAAESSLPSYTVTTTLLAGFGFIVGRQSIIFFFIRCKNVLNFF